MNKVKETITKPELRFWCWILGMVIAVVIWGTRLEGKVEAMYDKGTALRHDYEGSIVEIKADIREIKANQQKIMIRLGVEP